MKKFIIGLIFIITACASGPKKSEYININICNTDKKPIKCFSIYPVSNYDDEVIEITNSDGHVKLLSNIYKNSHIFIESQGYTGKLILINNDTTIYLSRDEWEQCK